MGKPNLTLDPVVLSSSSLSPSPSAASPAGCGAAGRRRRSDRVLQRGIRNTALLDSLWLAGETFNALWDIYIRGQAPDRYVTMKFEHQTQFEHYEADADTSLEHRDWYDEEVQERRASLMAGTERTQRLEEMLPRLRAIHPAFGAIKMLRFPATDQPGGYEFWSWGKVTYRSPSFRDGREQIRSVTRLYEQVTAAIERRVWLQIERVTMPENGGASLRGTPVVFQFQEPLSLPTFRSFVEVTFEREQGPLRLWGNPIRIGEAKVHVYGVDLHLWQRIYLEITRKHLLVVLPRGTCGNTVHRLLTNLQRYLDAGVTLHIGDVQYADLVRDVALGKEPAGYAV